MPPTVQDNANADRSEQMWKVLKAHILRERARKKQEREAEVEEERLRKEREAREQQDVMTLGETREHISRLESRLTQLKEEKHQLFLQLKKVLNEDDNRRRQLVKESSEQMLAMQALPTSMVHPQQLYIQPQQQQAQVSARIQAVAAPAPQAQPSALPQQAYKTAAKRPRSPSPPPPQQPPAQQLYHQGYGGYKPAGVGAASYQGSPQKDDGRRNELVRAVLWNKTPQYSSQPSAFYPVTPQELSIYYPPATRSVYESPRPQAFQLDHKLPDHYAALHGHVIHPTAMPLTPGQPSSKGGSITAGYPVRSQYQQPVPTSTLYTTQSRPIYQSSGGPISYQPRD